MMAVLDLLQPMFAALLPPLKMLPSEWAEANIVLPRESNSRPGRLRLTAAQRGMIDAAAEPGARVIVLMTATQCGKTTAINSVAGWSIAGESGPHLLVRPDDQDARAYIRENFDPIVAATPALRNIIGTGAKGLDSTGFKSFPGGSLAIVSSYKASALAGRSIRVLIADETDRFANIVSNGEGEPIALAMRRLQLFRHNSLAILASSPTHKATSRIAAWHERGDCRELFVECKSCKQSDTLTPDRLRFEPGQPETARLECVMCGHRATEAERLQMLDTAEWRATATGEPGVISFHMSELASEFSSLETIARIVDQAVTTDARKVLQNTVWGLPYEGLAEVELDSADLSARALAIEPPYPAHIDFVTAGVDVQMNRLELTFLAHAPHEKLVIDHIVLLGDTSGAKVWTDLDATLGTKFVMKDGRTIGLSATFIDAGYATEAVVNFVVAHRRKHRLSPITGRAGWDRPTIKAGGKLRGMVRNIIVGVDGVKVSVTAGLAARDTSTIPIRLPDHLDADYFAQLTAERLEVRHVKGFAKYEWRKENSVRNEALDTLVYAFAAASIVKGRATSAVPDASKPSMADRMIALNSINQSSRSLN